METHKFYGSSLEAAVASVHQRWGAEAIILNVEKKKQPGSWFGRGKQWIEVTVQTPAKIKPETASFSVETTPVSSDLVQEELQALQSEIQNFGVLFAIQF